MYISLYPGFNESKESPLLRKLIQVCEKESREEFQKMGESLPQSEWYLKIMEHIETVKLEKRV